MGQVKSRITALEAGMNNRRRAENELNRRIDNLVELVTEIDKKLDSIGDNRDNSEVVTPSDRGWT